MSAMKICSKCKKEKALSDFYKVSSSSESRRSACIECMDKQNREYISNNSFKISEIKRRWSSNNKDKRHESVRKWLAKHPGITAVWARNEYAKNPARGIAASRKWQKDHPDQHMAIVNRRRARKACVLNTLTAQEWSEIKQKYGCCLACGKKPPEIRLTQDHVIPIISGGDHAKDNIQPLCQSYNSRKHDKAIDYRLGWGKEEKTA